jgi:hypothetical protein
MSSKIESGLGAKIKQAQDLLVIVSQFQDYNPPRVEDQIPAFTTLVQQIVSVNTSIAQFSENYRISVDARRNEYIENEFSLIKLLSPICNAVEAQYGKDSKQTKLVREIARQLRSYRPNKTNPTPETLTVSKTVSKSEMSFGSMVQKFRNIVDTVSQYGDYAPQKAELQLANLQAKAEALVALNNDVLTKLQTLKTAQFNRTELYADLKQRALRIKSYIRANYGNKSQEYQLVKIIKF